MNNYRNFKLVYYFVAQATAGAEKEKLEKDIEDMEGILASKSRVKTIIINELKNVAAKYGSEK